MTYKNAQLIAEAYTTTARRRVKVVLELDERAVKKIQTSAQTNIKSLLEQEINKNTDTFIEAMGYDNW